ncbi:DUF3991 and toprim domain-containing protein [Eubacteriales bacterium OttesenSCG-928-M02]|nr:DUF3991 and toprim domain-containing protein [Eubacteriales bacterium OttesenSCG-928-M02]
MPYIMPEIVAKAKQMDLLTYLQNYEPHELVRVSGNTYCTRSHDSLKISNGKWFWWSRGFGGRSALDYLIKVNGLSFVDAVQQITRQAASNPPVFIPIQQQQPKALMLPARYPHTDAIEGYLESRGIDRDLIERCIYSGQLYENHNYVEASNRTYINAVFVGFDKDRTARYASLRGINGSFKGEAIGSDKRYSFSFPANESCGTLHLFESAIDLLSYVSIMKRTGKAYHQEHLLSLAGVYQPQKKLEESKIPVALSQYLQDYPFIERIELHLDNDRAGRLATAALMTILADRYQAIKAPPPCGKDFNDCLQEYIQSRKRTNRRTASR